MRKSVLLNVKIGNKTNEVQRESYPVVSIKLVHSHLSNFFEKKIVQVNNKSGINEIKGNQEQNALN